MTYFQRHQQRQEQRQQLKMSEREALTIEERVASRSDLDTLSCAICLSLVAAPIKQCASGHLGCGGCLDQIARSANPICPQCRIPISNGRLSRSLVADHMLSSLKVHCVNHFKYSHQRKKWEKNARGCQEIVTVATSDNHKLTCQYVLVKCQHKGCNEESLNDEMANHIVQCEYRSNIPCPFDDICKFTGTTTQLAQHILNSIYEHVKVNKEIEDIKIRSLEQELSKSGSRIKSLEKELKECKESIKIHCENQFKYSKDSKKWEKDARGCQEIVTVATSDNHKLICKYNLVKCQHKGCDVELLKDDMANHLAQCKYQPKEEKISCPFGTDICKYTGTKTEIDQHILNSISHHINVNNQRIDDQIKSLQQEFKDCMKSIKESNKNTKEEIQNSISMHIEANNQITDTNVEDLRLELMELIKESNKHAVIQFEWVIPNYLLKCPPPKARQG
ncbi:RING zinc finger-containing protein [Cavenderia fasciculata]|uniref:RING zinc finger-containing protein n=1 Tax=Cavenderia fasciculata TaxID=261658 RepID=F4PQR4_CACFS|nr:RING zinc finger-containing protein [Cavenderia fasciculata]EGG22022.1 RING zinc finger-containing protein [Cavenderia fasciculata]|eukprot:XP_004359873.1 RING zinc finger-containing protein [Cavenderia fasciculata]